MHIYNLQNIRNPEQQKLILLSNEIVLITQQQQCFLSGQATPNSRSNPSQNLAQDKQCNEYIVWLPSQNGFNICNVSGFISHVLPTYFKHSNYSSFVRQLNMYGFTKLRGKQGENVYEHKLFKRGNRASIKRIQRKTNIDHQQRLELVPYKPRNLSLRKPASTNSTSNSLCLIQQKQKLNQIQKLHKKQIQLQNKTINLLIRNKELQQQNQDIIKQIEDQELRKKKLMAQIMTILNVNGNANEQDIYGLIQGSKAVENGKNSDNVKNGNNRNGKNKNKNKYNGTQSLNISQIQQLHKNQHQKATKSTHSHSLQQLYKNQPVHVGNNHNINQQNQIQQHQQYLDDTIIKNNENKPVNILDENQNQVFLSLDDFVNINYDDMSDMLKF